MPGETQKVTTMSTVEELMSGITAHTLESNEDSDPLEYLKLEKLHAALLEKFDFKVGDLVEWKPGLRNKSTAYRKPLIITKVYKEPIIESEKDSGSAYFNLSIDLVCAEIVKGDFIEYHYDSRRFQPYESERKDND